MLLIPALPGVVKTEEHVTGCLLPSGQGLALGKPREIITGLSHTCYGLLAASHCCCWPGRLYRSTRAQTSRPTLLPPGSQASPPATLILLIILNTLTLLHKLWSLLHSMYIPYILMYITICTAPPYIYNVFYFIYMYFIFINVF